MRANVSLGFQENWWKHEAEGQMCFYFFRVFGKPDETQSQSLWNGFSKGPNLLTINTNQSGYEPLNMENGSFVNSDNFHATDMRF